MAIRIVRGIDRTRNKKVYSYGRLTHPGLGVRKTYMNVRNSPNDGSPFHPMNFGSDLKFWLRGDLGVTTRDSSVVKWECQVSGISFDETGFGDPPTLVAQDSRLNNVATVQFTNSLLTKLSSTGPIISDTWTWLIIGYWDAISDAPNLWQLNYSISPALVAGFLFSRQNYVSSYDQTTIISAQSDDADVDALSGVKAAFLLSQDATGDVNQTTLGYRNVNRRLGATDYVYSPTAIRLDTTLSMSNTYNKLSSIAEVLVISKPISDIFRLSPYIRDRYMIDLLDI
jgi:hypothetical protein